MNIHSQISPQDCMSFLFVYAQLMTDMSCVSLEYQSGQLYNWAAQWRVEKCCEVQCVTVGMRDIRWGK